VSPLVLALTLTSSLAVVGLLVAERRDSAAGRWLTKPVASLAFLGAGIAAGGLGTRPGQAIILALALSVVGDVCLIPRGVATFRAGLFAFLLGHVAFAASFVIRGIDAVATGVAIAVIAGPALALARYFVPKAPPALRGAVVAYILVISAMVALAAGTVAARGHPVLLAAAVTFFLSDITVARDVFVGRAFENRLIGLPLYYGAQLLFAWSVAGLG
jgi:uncharacterized membrane protein YhhN